MPRKTKKNKTKPKKLPPRLELISHFAYDVDTGELTLRESGKSVGWADDAGYRSVRYKGKVYKVHRIIYKMFHGKDPGNKVIDHRDGNPSNNCIDNLRCVIRRTNTRNRAETRKERGLPPKDINCTAISKNLQRARLAGDSDF